MDDTPNLKLPYIMAAQAQKHVTHNEAIRNLDSLVQLSVLDRDLTVPPGSPIDGDSYIPAAGSTGAWAGGDGQIASYQDNAWKFYQPNEGWRCWVADENVLAIHDGTGWNVISASAGGGSFTSNIAVHGASTSSHLLEEELSLSGAFIESSIQIPDRAIVLAVTTRTTEAIGGATSYDCGIAGETAKYGGTLGVAAGSTNSGVTGPTAFYADTPVRLTANGGNFTTGKVRLVIHFILCSASTS